MAGNEQLALWQLMEQVYPSATAWLRERGLTEVEDVAWRFDTIDEILLVEAEDGARQQLAELWAQVQPYNRSDGHSRAAAAVLRRSASREGGT